MTEPSVTVKTLKIYIFQEAFTRVGTVVASLDTTVHVKPFSIGDLWLGDRKRHERYRNFLLKLIIISSIIAILYCKLFY